MICKNCNTNLSNDTKFCTNCGTKILDIDKEIKLSLKPTFYMTYHFMKFFVILLVMILTQVLTMLNKDADTELSVKIGFILIVAFVFIGIPICIIYNKFKKKEYDKCFYNFYDTKIIYKDTFINKEEKEINYAFISEIVIQQTFLQRLFNIGNIIFYTNASSYNSGIVFKEIHDVEKVYKNIKQIINI